MKTMDLPEFASRDQMQEWVEQRLGGLKVRSTDFVCNPNRPHSALCVIEGDRVAMKEICMRVGGTMFGEITASLFLPVAPSFSCPMRPDGGSLKARRCECRPERKFSESAKSQPFAGVLLEQITNLR
ncbi:MAG: hypothetical protein ABFE02_05500 [Sulfuricella sp.]